MYVYCLLRGHCLQQLYHMLSELLAGETQPSWQVCISAVKLILLLIFKAKFERASIGSNAIYSKVACW